MEELRPHPRQRPTEDVSLHVFMHVKRIKSYEMVFPSTYQTWNATHLQWNVSCSQLGWFFTGDRLAEVHRDASLVCLTNHPPGQLLRHL